MDPKNSNQTTTSSPSHAVPRSLPPLPKVSISAEAVQKNVETSPITFTSISEKSSTNPTSLKTTSLSSKNEDIQNKETSPTPTVASDSSKPNTESIEHSQNILPSNQVSSQNRSIDLSGLSKPLKSRLDRRLSINIIRHEIIQDKKPYTVIDMP
jgi:hypothetical protein